MIRRAGAKFQGLFNLQNCCNYSITSYCMFPSFAHLKGWTGQLKMVNIFFEIICLHNKSLEQWTIKIWDALCNFVTSVQFKKLEKHLWRSVTFSFVKVTILHGILSQSSYVMLCKITYHLYNLKTWIFKLYKWYVIVQSITYEYATVLVWLSC